MHLNNRCWLFYAIPKAEMLCNAVLCISGSFSIVTCVIWMTNPGVEDENIVTGRMTYHLAHFSKDETTLRCFILKPLW